MSDRYVPSSMTRIADLQDDRFRVTSRAAVVPELPEVRYVGHVMRDGHKVVMSDFAVRGGGEREYAVPTVLVIGTSMSAGKTSTARTAIRPLLARMASAPVDVAVVEVGASPLEPYNGTPALDHLLRERLHLP